MSYWEIFVIGVGLSMDAFAVSVCKGLSVRKVRPRHCLTAGVYFGGFQALMPLLGWLLGRQFESLIKSVDHWIAFVLLALIGANMLREAFGEDVATLVEGVTKITKIEVETLSDKQAATIRKMLVAMNKDIRVIVIKLADRLHNMRTLGSLREDRRIFKSRETLEIYAPIAHRLGINSIKWELEKSGAKTAMGKTTWDLSTISRILQNRLYVGMLTYHMQYTPDYLEQKKVTNHGEIELLQLEGRHEHIISDELFDQVQKTLESRRRENRNMVILSRAQNGGAKTPDVWTRKLLCACGTSSTGCAGIRQNRGLSTEGICTSPALPDWRLQMMACAIFRLFTPAMEDVFELTKTTLGRHIGDDDSRNKEAEQIEKIKAEIGDLESCLNGLVEQRINGDLSKEDFSAKKTEYEAKITNLSSTLKELTKV